MRRRLICLAATLTAATVALMAAASTPSVTVSDEEGARVLGGAAAGCGYYTSGTVYCGSYAWCPGDWFPTGCPGLPSFYQPTFGGSQGIPSGGGTAYCYVCGTVYCGSVQVYANLGIGCSY